MMIKSLFKGVLLLSILSWSSCSISLSGVQVPIEVNTFNVEYIVNNALLVVPTLSQDVTDEIRERIENETRLNYVRENADIEFTGEIVKYEVASEAPTAGQNTTLNRLDIVVNIEFTNHKDEEANWTSKFSNFQNFDPSEDLAAVQDDLIEVILRDIVEDIYQKAFTNW